MYILTTIITLISLIILTLIFFGYIDRVADIIIGILIVCFILVLFNYIKNHRNN